MTDAATEETSTETGGRTFETIGIVGLGTMGAGIAEVFAREGYAVVGVEQDEAGVARILADLSDRSVGFRFDESRRMVPDPAPSICDGGATATADDVTPRTSTTTTTAPPA